MGDRGRRGAGAGETAPCPSCGAESGHSRPKFTWWGGLLGPKLLHHAICGQCRTGFNARTGQPNAGAIAVYVLVGVVIGAGLAALLFMQ